MFLCSHRAASSKNLAMGYFSCRHFRDGSDDMYGNVMAIVDSTKISIQSPTNPFVHWFRLFERTAYMVHAVSFNVYIKRVGNIIPVPWWYCRKAYDRGSRPLFKGSSLLMEDKGLSGVA